MAVISIIDDDASVRVATHRLVRSLGYTAHTFASADEFLRSSQLNDTSCVIADVQMPGMSGLELHNLLQTQGHFRAAKSCSLVIFIIRPPTATVPVKITPTIAAFSWPNCLIEP